MASKMAARNKCKGLLCKNWCTDFMYIISSDVIDAFNTTSRYLDDILNINNVYFDNMVSQIYP